MISPSHHDDWKSFKMARILIQLLIFKIMLYAVTCSTSIQLWDMITDNKDQLHKYVLTTECGDALSFITKEKFLSRSFVKFSGQSLDLPDVLDGTFSSLGQYDECLSLKIPYSNDSHDINGQYCNLKFIPNPTDVSHQLDPLIRRVQKIHKFLGAQFKVNIALCLPDVCSQNDVTRIFRVSESNDALLLFDTNSDIICDTSHYHVLSGYNNFQLVSLSFVIIIASCVTICSLMDVIASHPAVDNRVTENRWNKFILIFSARQNFNCLMFHESNDRDFDLDIMKSVLMMIVVMIHSAIGTDLRTIQKFFKAVSEGSSSMERLLFQPFLNDNLQSGFLCISSIVLVINFGKCLKENSSLLNIIKFIIKRWIRFTIIYLSAVAIHVSILPLFGSGPQFREFISHTVDSCSSGWWRVLLTISNYDDLFHMCLHQTWYFSAYIHLMMIGTIVLLLMFRYETIGLLTSFVIIIMGMVYPAYQNYVHHYPPGLMISQLEWVSGGDDDVFYSDIFLTAVSTGHPSDFSRLSTFRHQLIWFHSSLDSFMVTLESSTMDSKMSSTFR